MERLRIALANLRSPASPEDSVRLTVAAIAEAGAAAADLICFPECFVPGYLAPEKQVAPPDSVFLAAAWQEIAAAARQAEVAVVLGTERLEGDSLLATAMVIDRDGQVLGFQDKVQLDPSEEGIYAHGSGRRVFEIAGVTFGVVICHEGWRYPETVRWAARQGASIVFHPQFHEAGPDGYVATTFAEQGNTFHEKAILCRAAENTCFMATVNCASAGSATTSAVIRPDGTVLCYQPYGQEGLLLAEIDIREATGLLAQRYRPV